jgi:hypothetical protein
MGVILPPLPPSHPLPLHRWVVVGGQAGIGSAVPFSSGVFLAQIDVADRSFLLNSSESQSDARRQL